MNVAGPDPADYAALNYFPPQTGVRSVIVAINDTIMAMKNIFAILLSATIFIPLTFVVGIYGMNFANMPELQWRYGYFSILIVMAVIGTSLVVYFRRKR